MRVLLSRGQLPFPPAVRGAIAQPRLARTSCKTRQIISNAGRSFRGNEQYTFSFLTFHFGIVFGINPFRQEGSYWSSCTFQLLQTFSTFVITTRRRTNPASKTQLYSERIQPYNVYKCFQVLELIIFVWTLPSSFCLLIISYLPSKVFP